MGIKCVARPDGTTPGLGYGAARGRRLVCWGSARGILLVGGIKGWCIMEHLVSKWGGGSPIFEVHRPKEGSRTLGNGVSPKDGHVA